MPGVIGEYQLNTNWSQHLVSKSGPSPSPTKPNQFNFLQPPQARCRQRTLFTSMSQFYSGLPVKLAKFDDLTLRQQGLCDDLIAKLGSANLTGEVADDNTRRACGTLFSQPGTQTT